MERRTERRPASEPKYVIIAHERGSNIYVLAGSERGNIIACTEEVLNKCHRYPENLTYFTTLFANLWEKTGEKVGLGIIPQEDFDEDLERSVKKIFSGAVAAMGYPSKERVEFFSVPEEIVAAINWVPKKP